VRRIAGILILAAVWVAAAAGADVSGQWSGSFKATNPDGETRDGTALLILKQTGSEITGSVGPHADEQHAITKGKIEGDKITLESTDGGMTIKLELVVTGDRIAGDATANGEGRTMKAKLDVSRVKA
jgi:hypothetical protein